MNLQKIYNIVFVCFRQGQYDYPNAKKSKTRRKLSRLTAHQATLDFMLFAYCKVNGIPHWQHFDKLFVPRDDRWLAEWKDITLQEIIYFVSPETKKQETKQTLPTARSRKAS